MLFVANIDSVIDVITNSSSELFVFGNKTKDMVVELLTELHPDWKSEYYDIKTIGELTYDELDTYVHFISYANSWPAPKNAYPGVKGYKFHEVYDWDPKWKEYSLKKDFLTSQTRAEFEKRHDPDGKLLFLFSREENPSWEYQEKLMDFSHRYHLG